MGTDPETDLGAVFPADFCDDVRGAVCADETVDFTGIKILAGAVPSLNLGV
jgi:hypothetical protein